MLLAALHGVEKAYGEQVILQDATLELRDGDRVALIGRNGSGKTTLLRLFMGESEPDRGQLIRKDGATLAYLEQSPSWNETATIEQVSAAAFKELDQLEERLKKLEAASLQHANIYESWEELHATFERRGGYARRARKDAVLHALGFTGRTHQRVAELSGGERTRLGLALLLMAQPDVLLLDEPTNHLDIEMREWLEGHLARYPGAALIVSHDRAFLDGATSRTAQVGGGRLRNGPGNPTAFLTARAKEDALLEQARANQERELARLQASADQMKAWAGQNAKLHRRAKAMQRRADRYEDGMVSAEERSERNLRFSFHAPESGEIVLSAQHLSKSFGGRTLIRDANIELRSGDRIGLVGRNGEGKSTLLKMLVGELPSDDPRGAVTTGARVRLGYYDQELTGVDSENTLFEELHQRMGDAEAHNALGRFMFPYEAQFKRVKDLSGGERARLALLNLTLAERNLLIFDEPTNHLDVEMIAALEEALEAFTGTLLFVSHDRRFLNRLAEQVWEVRGGQLHKYEGDWEFYQRRRALETAQQAAAQRTAAAPKRQARETPPSRRGPSRWQLERRLETLEGEIEELEAELKRVSAKLASPGTLSGENNTGTGWQAEAGSGPPPTQAELLAGLGKRHAQLERRLLALMEEWSDASEQLAG